MGLIIKDNEPVNVNNDEPNNHEINNNENAPISQYHEDFHE